MTTPVVPTHVWGYGAAEYAQAKGWTNAEIMENETNWYHKPGAAGRTPDDRRIIFVTPGEYDGVNCYAGKRQYVTVTADPAERTVIEGGKITGGSMCELDVSNLELPSTSIGMGNYSQDPVPKVLNVSNCYLHSWTKEVNGIGNPSGGDDQPWEINVRDCVFDGVGGKGNTTHSIYVHGRPNGRLLVEDCEFRGSRNCSQIKTITSDVILRRNRMRTHSALTDYTAHTMMDICTAANVIIADNDFELFADKSLGKWSAGLHGAAIYLRLRRGIAGCDMPAYPDVSRDPPVSSTKSQGSPGMGWDSGPEVWLNDTFWRDVASYDRLDPDNPFSFKHFISGNVFDATSSVDEVRWLRDDGTYPMTAVRQFGPSYARWCHPNWVERSVTFTSGNRLIGDMLNPAPELLNFGYIAEFEDGCLWPVERPEHIPVVTEVERVLPDWFRR